MRQVVQAQDQVMQDAIAENRVKLPKPPMIVAEQVQLFETQVRQHISGARQKAVADIDGHAFIFGAGIGRRFASSSPARWRSLRAQLRRALPAAGRRDGETSAATPPATLAEASSVPQPGCRHRRHPCRRLWRAPRSAPRHWNGRRGPACRPENEAGGRA
jgi:hypothetical protein